MSKNEEIKRGKVMKVRQRKDFGNTVKKGRKDRYSEKERHNRNHVEE